MTLNFGTENIYFVPEGEKFCFIDMYHMKRKEWDISKWQVFFNKNHMQDIRLSFDTALKRWQNSLEKGKKKSSSQRKKNLGSFVDNIPYKRYPSQGILGANSLLSPQETTLWVRFSDIPQESFFSEDYQEHLKDTRKRIAVPVMGSFFLSHIGDFELNIHENVFDKSFFLSIPRNKPVLESDLPPERLLPLDEEFFGAFGSSGKGRMINLTHKARISKENLFCLPLCRSGVYFFATLYCHIRTNAEFDVVFTFSENKIDYARSVLAELGFTITCKCNSNEIHTRNRTVVHLYTNAVGKETFSSPFLPPFIFVTAYKGSSDPGKRSQLMEELLPHFSQ